MPTITSAVIKDFARRTKFINNQSTTLPICSSIILDYTGQNLKIYKTDTNKSAILTVEKSLQIAGDGRYLVEEKELLDFADARGPVITITETRTKAEVKSPGDRAEYTNIELKCGKATRKFQTDDIALFPAIPQQEGEVYEFGAEVTDAVKIAATFTGKDDLRLWQQHVIFQGRGVFATDNHKVYRCNIADDLPEMYLPLPIVQALPPGGIASLSQSENMLFLECGDLLVSVLKQQVGRVTDLAPFMMDGKEPLCTITLPKEAILPIISMAEKSGDPTQSITIEATEGGVRCFAEFGNLLDEDIIECAVTGAMAPIKLNAAYFRQLLYPFAGDIVLQNHAHLVRIEQDGQTGVLMKLVN